MWQISRPPCEWCQFGQFFNGQMGHLYKHKLGDWKTVHRVTELQSYRVTESQSDRRPRVQVGEIFLCLISINSPTRFARRGITLFDFIKRSIALLKWRELALA